MKTSPYSVVTCLLAASFLSVISCQKDQEDENQKQSAASSSELTTDTNDPAVQAAIEIIKEEKNLRITAIKDGRIHIRNKYTKVELDLSPEEVDEKKHQTLAAFGPQHVENSPLEKQTAPDWGKAPEWIPRYPGAVVQRGAMHAPLKDGSIWGNVTITHTDSVIMVADFLKQQFAKQELKLATEMTRKGTTFLVFQRMADEQEKRRITCTLSKTGEKTRASIQYSYGMP